jgi:replicative DNA helicase
MAEQANSKLIEQEQARLRWLQSFERRDRKRFFPSAFGVHERVVGKFLRAALYIIAARPGVGKTAYLVALAYHLARQKIKTIYASLEIPIERIWNRLACLHDVNLTLRELNETEPTPQRLQYFETLSREIVGFSPRFIEDPDFAAFVKAMKEEVQPGSDSIVLVDYAGLFTLKGLGPQERYWLMSEVAKQLSLMARALDIPVVTAVQFNRGIENRKEKKPTLADLRDTGEWENHARGVFMLTREVPDRLDVYVEKNTEGPAPVSYSLHFDGPRAAVEELD